MIQTALSWELPCHDSQVSQGAHPERKAWSEALYSEIEAQWFNFIKASDIKTIIPNLGQLTDPQAITVMCELLSGVAKYESSWIPTCISTDVNGSTKAENMATGLFQMNASSDQSIYHTGTSFTHAELMDPINNIKTAVGIIVYLIQKRGQILFTVGHGGMPSAFFETLLFGAKYPNVNTILAMAHAVKFQVGIPFALPPLSSSNAHPWTSWFEQRMGWTEFDHDMELSKGWIYTNVPGYKTVIGAKYAWCAMSLNTALSACGYKGTHDASAVSFQDYGNACAIIPGCIIVIQHASGEHHVTTFVGWVDEANKIGHFLGGNQSNSICIAEYNVSGNKAGHDEIIASRWPIKF